MSQRTDKTPLLSSSTMKRPSTDDESLSTECVSVTLPPESSSRSGGARPCGRARHPRFRWTNDLHRRFLNAVEMLGGEQSATPKAVFDLMDAKEVTLNHVRSLLQNYRNSSHEQLTREASTAAMARTDSVPQDNVQQNNNVPNSVQVRYPPHGYPYHQFYNPPPPTSPPPPRRPACLYIDPVGPMPPSIPPSMRKLDYSASEPKTIVFKDLFTECKPKPIDENGAPADMQTSGAKKLVAGTRMIRNPSEESVSSVPFLLSPLVPSSSTTMDENHDISLELTLSYTQPSEF